MAYQKTTSYKIPLDDEEIYALSILAARQQGKTLGEFTRAALANAIHVHNRQKHHNAPHEERPITRATSLQAPSRLPPKPR